MLFVKLFPTAKEGDVKLWEDLEGLCKEFPGLEEEKAKEKSLYQVGVENALRYSMATGKRLLHGHTQSCQVGGDFFKFEVPAERALPREYFLLKQQASLFQLLMLGKKADIPLPGEPGSIFPKTAHSSYQYLNSRGDKITVDKYTGKYCARFSDYYIQRGEETRRPKHAFPYNLNSSKLADLLDWRDGRGPTRFSRKMQMVHEDLFQCGQPLESIYKQYSTVAKDIEEFRELCLALVYDNFWMGDIKIEKDFHVGKLVAHFAKYIDNLAQKDYQELFRYALFEGLFLENMLTKSPALAAHVHDLIERGYNKFVDLENTQTALFFLHLKLLAAPILSPYRKGFCSKEIEENLTAQLRNPRISVHEKALASRLLIAAYSLAVSPLSKGDVQRILHALAHIAMHPLPEELQISALDQHMQKVLLRLSDTIRDALCADPVACAALLNGAIRSVDPEFKARAAWDITLFPWCVTEGDALAFHALEGIICQRGGGISLLPSALSEDPAFARQFGKALKDIRYLGSGVYTFQNRHDQTIRIIVQEQVLGVQPGKQLMFATQREIAGRWYAYIKEDVVAKMPFPNRALKEFCTFWQKMPLSSALSSAPGAPLDALLDSQKMPGEILALDHKTDKPAYRIVVAADLSIAAIERLASPGVPPLRLVDIDYDARASREFIVERMVGEAEKFLLTLDVKGRVYAKWDLRAIISANKENEDEMYAIRYAKLKKDIAKLFQEKDSAAFSAAYKRGGEDGKASFTVADVDRLLEFLEKFYATCLQSRQRKRLEPQKVALIDQAKQTLLALGKKQITVEFGHLCDLLMQDDLSAFAKSYPALSASDAHRLKMDLTQHWEKHSTDYSFAGRIEDIAYVNVWEKVDEAGLKEGLPGAVTTPCLIELPRLGLQLSIEKREGRLCAALGSPHTGLFVSSEQRIKGLGTFKNYLVIEDVKGKRQVLIPRREIDYSCMLPGALTTEITLNPAPPLDAQKADNFLIYDLDAQSNLVSTKPQDSLYLAYLLLGKKQYPQACDLLRGYAVKTKPYSPAERTIFDWFLRLQPQKKEGKDSPKDISDKDPKGTAVYLCALACLLKNADSFEQPYLSRNIDWEAVAHKYLTQYLTVSEHATYLKLTHAEEALLLNQVKGALLENGKAIAPEILTRLEELEEGIQSDLRIIPAGQISPQKPISELSARNLREAILAKPEKWSGNRVVRLGRAMGASFLPYYNMAKRRDPQCIEMLRMMQGEEPNRALAAFLEVVWHNPDLFPSTMELKALAANDREGLREFDLLVESGHKLWLTLEKPEKDAHREVLASRRLTGPFSSAKLNLTTMAEISPAVMRKRALFLKQPASLVSASVIQSLFAQRASTSESEEKAAKKLSDCLIDPQYAALLADVAFDAKQCIEPTYALRELEGSIKERNQWRSLRQLTFKYDQEVCHAANAHLKLDKGSISLADILSLVSSGSTLQFEKKYPQFSKEVIIELQSKLKATLIALERRYSLADKMISSPPTELPVVDLQDTGAPLTVLYTDLMVKTALLKRDALALEVRILSLANAVPLTTTQGLVTAAEKQGTLRERMQLNALLVMFIQKDKSEFKKRNPTLQSADIDTLQSYIMEYLIQETLRQQIARAINTLKEMQAKGVVERADQDLPRLANQLHSELSLVRAYDPALRPEYLLFEYSSDKTLRPDQVENLDKLLYAAKGSNPQMILQMIMGSGKSKVFLPILALKNADGDALSLVVVPEALYETVAEDLLHQSRGVFKQMTHTLHFDRNTVFTKQKLQAMLSQLEMIRQRKDYVIMTSKSLACLKLKVQEAFSLYAHAPNPELAEKIEVMRSILNLIKSKGKAVIDEADTILNCKHEVIFSMGKAVPLAEPHRSVVSKLFEMLLTNKSISAYFPQGLLATPITKEIYEAVIKPLLISEIVSSWSHALPSSAKEAFKSAFELLVQKFLSNALDPEGEKELHSHLAALGELELPLLGGVKDLPLLKNALALIKGQINDLLPVTLTKECDTHYGFAKDFAKLIAVPYLASNTPSETSQFGNPYELLNYTVQMYYRKGIPQEVLKNHIQRLQRDAKIALSRDPLLRVEQTAAYAIFRKISPGSAIHLLTCTDQDIEKLKKDIQTTCHRSGESNLLLEYVREFVLPEILIYPNKLSVNPQGLFEMFAQVQGFTGTPWNSATFPNALNTVATEGTDGKTINILWKQCRGGVIPLAIKASASKGAEGDAQSQDSLAASLVDSMVSSQTSPDFRAIIDTGALFKGIPNREVAKALRERFKKERAEIKGICFYEGDSLMVLEKERDDPLPFRESALQGSPHERFTYYDHRHTTGADIKQAPRAHAVATFSKDLSLRDLLQGVWRMREIDKGQRISLVYHKQEAAIIRQVLDMGKTEDIAIEHILMFAHKVQMLQQQFHCTAAANQKLRNEVESPVWNSFMDPDYTVEELCRPFLASESIFIRPALDMPDAVYGRKEALAGKDEAIAARIDLELQTFEKINQAFHSADGEKPQTDTLERQSQAMLHKLSQAVGADTLKLMPEKIPLSIRESGTEVEQENELRSEKETQSLEMSVEQIPATPQYWKWDLDWNIKSELGDWEAHLTPLSRDFYRIEDPRDFKCPANSVDQKGPPPLWHFSALAAFQKDLQPYAELFEEDMLASYNFMPVQFRYNKLDAHGILLATSMHTAAMFDKNQYPFQHRLVVKEKMEGGKTRLRTLALEDKEAWNLSKRLGEQAPKDADTELFLVDKTLGLLQQSTNADSKELLDDPRYARHQVVFDFFDGELNFAPAQRSTLLKWLTEKPGRPALAKQLFENVILKHKPYKISLYAYSWLKNQFDVLGKVQK